MKAYDGTLQMFVEPVREPDMERLTFLRWLVQTGRLTGDTLPTADTVPAALSAPLAPAYNRHNVFGASLAGQRTSPAA